MSNPRAMFDDPATEAAIKRMFPGAAVTKESDHFLINIPHLWGISIYYVSSVINLAYCYGFGLAMVGPPIPFDDLESMKAALLQIRMRIVANAIAAIRACGANNVEITFNESAMT